MIWLPVFGSLATALLRRHLAVTVVLLAAPALRAELPAPRPNILWLTSEDHGIQVGCYGDAQAVTPHIDALAAKGLRYRFVWSNAPVCAPARTTLISGLYPTATGGEHMRSAVPFPAGLAMYPRLLQEAGYYTSNNVKEDYNFVDPAGGKGWDDSSREAHWRNGPEGRPFFAVFNSTRSHENQIRRPGAPSHDPARMRVPAYHPDTPEVRRDWAFYYDSVSAADADAGQRLAELEEAGLADDTIVFYFADHGSGMPRSKRWPGNSGLQVPLVVYIPEKFGHLRPADYQPGGVSDRLVSFVDFAPTLLSLVGAKPCEWMQGRAFLGPRPAPAPVAVHGFRGRMDERHDLVRSVSDGRYVYIRNYLPYLPSGQHVAFQFRTPTTRQWQERFLANDVNPAQAAFWQPHPAEELYDLQVDPDEIRNLANSPTHTAIKARLRSAQQAQAREIVDVGFLPEIELLNRRPGLSPYDLARLPGAYPFAEVFAMAELASLGGAAAVPALCEGARASDSAVRYWAVVGLRIQGGANAAALTALRQALGDPAPAVRIAAAEALVRSGPKADRAGALEVLATLADPAKNEALTAFTALGALDALGPVAAPLRERIAGFTAEAARLPHGRYNILLPDLLQHLKQELQP
jgi:arylsulfatase A-like enzyme